MNKKGYTLIEILLVILVLSILASIAVPTFMSYRTQAHNAAAISDLRNVKTVLELYYKDNGHYP